MSSVRSDAGFAVRVAMAAWAAMVPVLNLASAQVGPRPAIVIERICSMPDAPETCALAAACVSEATRSCAAPARDATFAPEAAVAGTPWRAAQNAPVPRCCLCICLGDLSMVAAPALSPTVAMPSLGNVDDVARSVPSRTPAPSSPPPEHC